MPPPRNRASARAVPLASHPASAPASCLAERWQGSRGNARDVQDAAATSLWRALARPASRAPAAVHSGERNCVNGPQTHPFGKAPPAPWAGDRPIRRDTRDRRVAGAPAALTGLNAPPSSVSAKLGHQLAPFALAEATLFLLHRLTVEHATDRPPCAGGKMYAAQHVLGERFMHQRHPAPHCIQHRLGVDPDFILGMLISAERQE